jgi:hypothetical protein
MRYGSNLTIAGTALQLSRYHQNLSGQFPKDRLEFVRRRCRVPRGRGASRGSCRGRRNRPQGVTRDGHSGDGSTPICSHCWLAESLKDAARPCIQSLLGSLVPNLALRCDANGGRAAQAAARHA